MLSTLRSRLFPLAYLVKCFLVHSSKSTSLLVSSPPITSAKKKRSTHRVDRDKYIGLLPSRRGKRAQPLKQILKQAITVDMIYILYKVPAPVKCPIAIVFGNRRRYCSLQHIPSIQQIGYRRYVPNGACPASNFAFIPGCLAGNVIQIVAQSIFPSRYLRSSGSLVVKDETTPLQGKRTTAAPHPKTTRAAAMSWRILNSRLSCQ